MRARHGARPWIAFPRDRPKDAHRRPDRRSRGSRKTGTRSQTDTGLVESAALEFSASFMPPCISCFFRRRFPPLSPPRCLASAVAGLRVPRPAHAGTRRPLQAAQRRGRRCPARSTCQADQRLQRQRRRHQGHDRRSAPRRIEVRETPDGYQHGRRDRLRRASRRPSGRSATASTSTSRAKPSASNTTARPTRVRFVNHAVMRRLRGGDVDRRDHRQPRHLRQHHRRLQRRRRRAGDAVEPGRPRARRADAARGQRRRRRGGAAAAAPRRRRAALRAEHARSEASDERRRRARRAPAAAPAGSRRAACRSPTAARKVVQGRVARRRQRRGGRPARPERRRQDDVAST